MIACPRCNGSGFDPDRVTQCCGAPIRDGKCCHDPLPLESQPCTHCYGTGHDPEAP